LESGAPCSLHWGFPPNARARVLARHRAPCCITQPTALPRFKNAAGIHRRHHAIHDRADAPGAENAVVRSFRIASRSRRYSPTFLLPVQQLVLTRRATFSQTLARPALLLEQLLVVERTADRVESREQRAVDRLEPLRRACFLQSSHALHSPLRRALDNRQQHRHANAITVLAWFQIACGRYSL
jgi:hypothetical protein